MYYANERKISIALSKWLFSKAKLFGNDSMSFVSTQKYFSIL